jgi:beta-phosphoglucomutase-like phosphatase (HAD superfamily)
MHEKMAIEAVIFDMDGVLIDARDWHFEALNEALRIFGEEITLIDHEGVFNGLPTKVKLQMLVEENRINSGLTHIIEAVKQERTLRTAANLCFPRVEHLIMLAELKRRQIRVGVATNSIRKSAVTMLGYGGVLDYLDTLVSNEDVAVGKPSPDIYIKACQNLSVNPRNTLVVEDKPIGVKAAMDSGCHVLQVEGPEFLDLALVDSKIYEVIDG